ncbi:hypothetical protein AFLA_004288 [Aspergillus flavus NRRL3357]|nr:hypothetical protein AFLA_004288 [Aspergillus flavus NRRL3357]
MAWTTVGLLYPRRLVKQAKTLSLLNHCLWSLTSAQTVRVLGLIGSYPFLICMCALCTPYLESLDTALTMTLSCLLRIQSPAYLDKDFPNLTSDGVASQ